MIVMRGASNEKMPAARSMTPWAGGGVSGKLVEYALTAGQWIKTDKPRTVQIFANQKHYYCTASYGYRSFLSLYVPPTSACRSDILAVVKFIHRRFCTLNLHDDFGSQPRQQTF